MQILLKVDQKAALQRGINAPNSTVTLDVDPAVLTQHERDVLAAVLIDGHDATRLGIQSEPDDIVGQQRAGNQLHANGSPTRPLLLVQPELDGLREAIRVMCAEREEKRADMQAQKEKVWAEERERLERFISAPARPYPIRLRGDGSVVESSTDPALLTVSFMRIETCCIQYTWKLSPADSTRLDAWVAEANAKNEVAKREAIELAKLELRRLVAKLEAKKQAEADAAAAIQKERESMIARLPEAFRARIKAGYADQREVNIALRSMARADAGIAHTGYKESRELKTLSDDEFLALEQVRVEIAKRLPNATVEPMLLADEFEYWRKATDSDDPAAIDDDGEVLEPAVNLRRQIVVTWQVAGLTVKAALPFEPLPERV